MFKVECLGCQAPYQVDERRVPEKGLKMRCPKCGTTFKVEPPAQGTSPSQAPAPEPEAPRTAAPPTPFASAGLDPLNKLAKPPAARDALARTMIGVSSNEMDQLAKEASAAKPKAFRIPRPNQGPNAQAPAAAPPVAAASPAAQPAPAVADPSLDLEVDLPATPLRARSLGLTAAGRFDDAALPEVVRSAKSPPVPGPREVQPVMPSAATTSGSGWPAPDVNDAPVDSKESTVPLQLSDLPMPIIAAAMGADEVRQPAPAKQGPPLELDVHDDLPIVASPQKRPPPRRHRPAQHEAGEEPADLPARPQDVDVGLPAVAAPPQPPPRPLDRAPRPPSRQKGPPFADLDLPATAPRDLPIAGLPMARASRAEAVPAPARDAESPLDLPSLPRARQAPPGLSGADLPAVGRGRSPADLEASRRAPTAADLPAVGRAQPAAGLPLVGHGQPAADLPAAFRAPTNVDSIAAQRAQHSVDLPSIGRAPTRADLPATGRMQPAGVVPAPIPSELPGVLGGIVTSARAPTRDVVALPEVLSSGLPEVVAPGLPRVAKVHDELPDVLGGHADGGAAGLPEVQGIGLPRVSDSGLPGVLGGYSSDVGLPETAGVGLPQISDSGLPDVLGAGLPELQSTGLPDVLGAGLPDMPTAGLPDMLASGLPIISPAGLPQPRAPGVSGGFGRVDLPVPRAADLPERSRMGFDEVDLPGVGESLPSVSEHWGSANLPTVGETLPTAKGQPGEFDEAGTAFDAFGDPGESDPFAGAQASFGAAEADDPFAPPIGAPGDEYAPEGATDAAHAMGAGYGEVDIGGGEAGGSALETADDMEFQAIPQHGSAAPGRAAAAASASVHAESPDAEATGSTLELGPERKAPKARSRRMAIAVAVALGAIGGGALALKPAIGPFGINFVMDRLKRGEHERLLEKLVADAREAAAHDMLPVVQGSLRELEKARADAPRFVPLSARSALEHYAAALRYGPLPNLEATAKVALDQVDPEADDTPARLARAAQAAVARAGDAKSRLAGLSDDPVAKELIGELSLREKDWAGAAKVWAELRQIEPKSARAAYGLSRAELGLGKLSEASAHAREALAVEPDHVGAKILLLEAQRAQVAESNAGKPVATEELVAAVTQALQNASPGEAALAHCVLGELHASQGRAGPAQQAFEAALVVDRAMPRALIGLGEVLHQARRDSEALARFQAAAQAEPGNLQAQLGIAKSQIQLAHLPEAKAVLARLAETNKGNPELIYWTGRSEQALGNTDAALAAYRASIEASKGRPNAVEAYLALAKLQADLGQLAVAQDTLNEARGKLPPNGPLHKALGEIAMSRADYSGAYDHFQKAIELDSGDTRARFLGAVALTRLGRFEEALTAFQTVGKTDKDFPGLAVERGRLFEESGRNSEALAEFEAALKKSPDDPEVQVRVGCSRVIAGQAAAAQPLLEAAAKARPRSAEANYCLGRSLFDQERFTDALMRLERAISLDPSRAVYHQFLGWVASEMGKQGTAQEAFDKAIELDKGLADAYWLRGRLRLKQGAARDAIVDLERARQLKPTRYDAIADLAVAYADTGRMPKALDLWEEAIARDSDNPTWHFRYGKLLSSSGNGAMAAAHLKRAIDLLNEAERGLSPGAVKPKQPLWLWQAHYLLARELGTVPASIPHWQAYLRLSVRDDPYRPEAERALRALGQPWSQR